MTTSAASLKGEQRAPVVRLSLPYDSWDPDVDVALLRSGLDDSLGILWEATPLSVELMSSDGLGHLAGQVASALRATPERSSLQIMLISRPTEGRELDRWLAGSASDSGVLSGMARARVRFLRDFCFESGPVLYFARDLRLYVALRSMPIPLPRVFKDPKGAAERAYLSARAEFLSGGEDLEGAAQALGIRLRRLGYEETHETMWKILNPTSARDGVVPKAHPDRPMAEQLLSAPILRDFRAGTLSLDGVHFRTLTAYLLPAQTQAGQMTLETIAGTVRMAIVDLIPFGRVTLSLTKPDQETLRTQLAVKQLLASAQGGISAAARQIAGDTLGFTNFLADGHDAYRAMVHVVLGASDVELLTKRARLARSALEALGFAMVAEDAYAEVAFTRSLPLGTSPADDDETERAVTMGDVSAAHVAPMWLGFAGTQTPDHLLLDRRGRVTHFSLFDTPTRVGHTVIFAPTGSGKSMAVKTLICDILRKGGAVAVLNKHTLQDLATNDYYRLAQILGALGHFMAFDVAKPPDLDVCAGPYNADTNLFLTSLLSAIVCMGMKNYDPAPKEINAISERIDHAWRFHGVRKGRMKLSDIRAMLASSEVPMIQDLAQSLAMFTRNGVFGGFFDGEKDNLIPPGARFVCAEMNQLADHPEVLTPLALMLFHKFTRWFESLPTDVPKLLVVEEAWMLLENSRTSDYVAKRQRTYRKLRGAIAIVSQHARDLDNPAGRAILGDKVNLILLRHQAQEAADTAEFLKLTPEQHQALRSLGGCPGYYSELLLIAPYTEGVGRLILGPHNYWALTSDGRDLATIEEERKVLTEKLGRPPEMMELVDQLARKFPYGRIEAGAVKAT